MFSKPSLQSLPILACSMSDIFWNSLLAHTAIPTVPIKNPFPYHWYSANSNCAKGPIIERILRRITLFQSFPISLKHGQGSQLPNSSRLHFNFGFFILYSSPPIPSLEILSFRQRIWCLLKLESKTLSLDLELSNSSNTKAKQNKK